MDRVYDRCPITGYELKPAEILPTTGMAMVYQTEYVGKVKVALSVFDELLNGLFPRDLIGGICLHRTIDGLEPVLIDSQFIREGYKEHKPPTEFDEKCNVLVRVLYQLYGKENRTFELNTTKHFALAYSSPEEFGRIIDQLVSDGFLKVGKKQSMGRDNSRIVYLTVQMTNAGKREAKKALPKMPMFGLVNQEISTGDREIDERINHARNLFFSEPQTLDHMRSACETLSFVLEPLRDSLRGYFSTNDVSAFFQIVNTFDIRHNKDHTARLVEPEQLEWVFYTLLNTISAYYKLKERLSL
jgi:hypothetical protein